MDGGGEGVLRLPEVIACAVEREAFVVDELARGVVAVDLQRATPKPAPVRQAGNQ